MGFSPHIESFFTCVFFKVLLINTSLILLVFTIGHTRNKGLSKVSWRLSLPLTHNQEAIKATNKHTNWQTNKRHQLRTHIAESSYIKQWLTLLMQWLPLTAIVHVDVHVATFLYWCTQFLQMWFFSQIWLFSYDYEFIFKISLLSWNQADVSLSKQ